MSVCIRKDGTIFVQWEENSKKRRKYFGKGIMAMGEAVRYNERHAAPTGGGRVALGPKFVDLVNEYLVAKVPGMRMVAAKNLSYKMRGVILPELGDIEAMLITPAVLDRYVATRSKLVKATTIHRELSDVRAILRWAVKRQLIPRCPMDGFEMPKRDDTQILPFSQSEIEAIILNSPEHLRRALLLSFFCGLRPGAVELLSIKYNQVNWSARSITVISASKGGLAQREIPVHSALPIREWFEADGSDPERHIITWKGQPVKNVKTAWASAKKAAGVGGRKMPMYALRHSFVSTLLRLGVDPRTIADMAGHDVVTMMKHYAYSMDSTRVAAIDLLPNVHPPGASSEDFQEKIPKNLLNNIK